jgi:hypothetical protein
MKVIHISGRTPYSCLRFMTISARADGLFGMVGTRACNYVFFWKARGQVKSLPYG